jgi:hypothetical protein
MGQGFLRWALNNRSAFGAITHPDVARYADAALTSAQTHFRATIRDAVDAAQQAGRQTDANPLALLLFTHAVPFGAAMILANPLLVSSGEDQQPEHQLTQHELIAAVINLVVPIHWRHQKQFLNHLVPISNHEHAADLSAPRTRLPLC